MAVWFGFLREHLSGWSLALFLSFCGYLEQESNYDFIWLFLTSKLELGEESRPTLSDFASLWIEKFCIEKLCISWHPLCEWFTWLHLLKRLKNSSSFRNPSSLIFDRFCWHSQQVFQWRIPISSFLLIQLWILFIEFCLCEVRLIGKLGYEI